MIAAHGLLRGDGGDDLKPVKLVGPEERQDARIAKHLGCDRREDRLIQPEGIADLPHRPRLIGGKHGGFIKKVQPAHPVSLGFR